MAKAVGTRNFSPEEGQRLADLAAQGLSKVEAAKLLGRSYWAVMRRGKSLGLVFAPRPAKHSRSSYVADPKDAEARAQRRRIEDRVIQELAINGWSIGLAALEIDIDLSQMVRHSKRLGITWTKYPSRSNKGNPVSGLPELRRARAKARKVR